MACKQALPFILLSIIGSLHLGACLSLAKGADGARELPGLAVVAASAAVFLLLAYLLIGCVCCPNRSIKALSYQNGFPASRLNENSQLESGSEFAIFPPQSAVIDLQPVAFDDKVTFEPLPDVLPLRNPTIAARPPHFRALLRNKVSLHDWFDDPSLNFPRDQLQYFCELGCGWFGRVVEGEAANIFNTEDKTPVIVKILREEASPSEHLHFLHEVRAYRDLSHPNVLRLLGRCLESDPFLLILEHSTSDLKSFLIQHENKEVLLKNGTLLQMTCNVVSGLKHLHDNSYTHLDLAAHNCFVCRDLTVKVGDYGISFDQNRGDYYCLGDIALPIRWCSPETLICTESTIEMKEISKEANIWSFGVVLWEMFEFGRLPYKELSNEEVLQKVLIERSVLLSPPSCPFPGKNEMCIVMQECWKPPKLRPTVHKLDLFLSRLNNDHHNMQTLQDEHSFEERWNALKRSGLQSDEGSSLDATSSFDPISRDGRLSPSLRVLNGSADEMTDVCLTDDFSASNDLEVSIGSDLPLDGQWTGSMDGVLIGGGGSLERTGNYLDHKVGDLQYHSLERAGRQKLYLERSGSNNYAPDLPLDGPQWSGSSDAVLSGRKIKYMDQGANNNVQYNSLGRAIRPALWEPSAGRFDSNVAAFGNNLERAFGHQGFHSDQNVLDTFGAGEPFVEVGQKPSNGLNFHSDQNVNGKFSVFNNGNFVQSNNVDPYPNFYSGPDMNGVVVDSNFNQMSDGETPVVERDVMGDFSVVVDKQSKPILKAVPDIVIHESPHVIDRSHDENVGDEVAENTPCYTAETPKTFRFVFKEDLHSDGTSESSGASEKRGRPLTSTPMKSNDFGTSLNGLSTLSNGPAEQDNSGEVFYSGSFTESSAVVAPENQTEARDSGETVFYDIQSQPDVNNLQSVSGLESIGQNRFVSARSDFTLSHISNDPKTSFSYTTPEKASETVIESKALLPSKESNACAFVHETESSNNGNIELLKCPSSSIKLKERAEQDISHSDSVSLECGEPITPDVSINVSSSFSYGNNEGSLGSPPINNQLSPAVELAAPEVSMMNVSGFPTENGLLPLVLESIGEVNTPDISINVSSYGNDDDGGSMDSPPPPINSQRPANDDNRESGTPDISVSFGNDYSMDSPLSDHERLQLDERRHKEPVTPDVSINISSYSYGNDYSMESPPGSDNDQLPPVERKRFHIDSEDLSSSDLLDSYSDSSFPNRMESAANARPPLDNNNRLMLMQGYDEVVVEDLETGEQTVSYSTDYEEASDEILRVDTETDEAIIVDASDGLVGFVPSRSIELLQECEILPPTYMIPEEKESSESNHLDASDSASSSPGCHPSPEVMFHRNFCLQDEVIEEEITEEMASPSQRSTLSSEGSYSEERPASRGSPERPLEVDSEDEAYDDTPDWRNGGAWQDQHDVPPLVIEGREIMAGGMLETHGMSVRDLTTALNNLDHLSVSQSPSPYSSLESSPCREAYTPDFDSEDEESESCSSTSGSFECLNNRFKAMGDISQVPPAREEDSSSEPASRERSPCKVFSGTWDCNATPTKGLLITPEKKLSSLRKSVSFHEEDQKVVYEYPPQSDSSEDNEPVHQFTVDYENYEDWELQVGDNDEEIEEVLEIEELEEEPYVRRPVSRPMSLYSLTSGFSDDDMDSSAAPSNSPEEGKHGPLTESQISDLVRDQLSSLALEENRLIRMQDALENQVSAFQTQKGIEAERNLNDTLVDAQLQDEENFKEEEIESGLDEYDEDLILNEPFPKENEIGNQKFSDRLLDAAAENQPVKTAKSVPQSNSVLISKDLEWELQEPVIEKPNSLLLSSFEDFGDIQLPSSHEKFVGDCKEDFFHPGKDINFASQEVVSTPSLVEMTYGEGNRRPSLSSKHKAALENDNLSSKLSFVEDVLNSDKNSPISKEGMSSAEFNNNVALTSDGDVKLSLESSVFSETGDKGSLHSEEETKDIVYENQLRNDSEFKLEEFSKDMSLCDYSNKSISTFEETNFKNKNEVEDSLKNLFSNEVPQASVDSNIVKTESEILDDTNIFKMPLKNDISSDKIQEMLSIKVSTLIEDKELLIKDEEETCPRQDNIQNLNMVNPKEADIMHNSEKVNYDAGDFFQVCETVKNDLEKAVEENESEVSMPQIASELGSGSDSLNNALASERHLEKECLESDLNVEEVPKLSTDLVDKTSEKDAEAINVSKREEIMTSEKDKESIPNIDSENTNSFSKNPELVLSKSKKDMQLDDDSCSSSIQDLLHGSSSSEQTSAIRTFPSHQESALNVKKNVEGPKVEPVPKIVVTPASESEFEDRELEEFLRSQLELYGNEDEFAVTSQFAVAPFDDVFGSSCSDYPEAFNFEFERDEKDFFGTLDSPMVEKRRSDSEDSMAKLDSSPALYYATSDATHL